MKVAMILGKWSTGLHGHIVPEDLYVSRALTGSESSFFNMARALAERGHTVNVYCDCSVEAGQYNNLSGANILSIDRELDGTSDVYVALNEPEQLKRAPKNKLRICWQQLGDFPGNQDPDFDQYVDRYVALSPRHMEYIIDSSAIGPRSSTASKWCWAPNSINADMAPGEAVERRYASMVWCSSPDRGLHRLLEIFPEIQDRVPEATLDIFYRFDPWYEMAKKLSDPIGDRARYIHECLLRLGRNGENGVTVHGPVSNVEMASHLRRTVLLPYTCDCLRFTETFSVSILDACLAGCVPLISNEDAIAQVFGAVAPVIEGKPGAKRGDWIENCVQALTDMTWAQRVSGRAQEFAMNFDRGNVVKIWEDIFAGAEAKALPQSISEFITMYDKNVMRTKINPFGVKEPAKELVQTEPVKQAIQTFEMGDKPLRIAVILGKTGSPVHGILDVERVFSEEGAFATGTVTGFFNIAWGLAELGHTIDAFCECKENVVGSKLGGAHFYNIDREGISPSYDAYISVNESDMLRGKPPEKAKIVALWLNDFSYCAAGWDEHVDVYACPSNAHRTYIRSRGEVPSAKLDVIPLCVSWELFDEAVPRRPGSIAYCSSPDRGLHHILAMFPEIQRRVPKANLSVYYRVKPWYETIVATKQLDGSHMRWRADQIKIGFDELGEDGSRGVKLVGAVSPRRMARELRGTIVMAYPCDPVRFTEGFSAAVLDSCAAGCVPIIAGVDALPEIYWGAAHIISGNPGDRQKAWVDAVCLALTDEGFAAEIRADARARARDMSRAKVAARWEALIKDTMRRKAGR